MPAERKIHGTLGQCETPVWEPLRAAVGLFRADWFMWMCEVELEDGTHAHCYKHVSTRRSMHLAEDGRAFGYAGKETYIEMDRDELVDLVHLGWSPLDDP